MLEDTKNVIAAYPYGDTHQVQILAKKTGVFTKDSIKKLIEKNKKFKVTDFSKTNPPKDQAVRTKKGAGARTRL